MRRLGSIAVALVAVAAALWLLTPPAVSDYVSPAPDFGDDLDDWIAARESAANDSFGLVEGAEQRIRWQVPGERTAYAIVHLHGFSATRQETAPLAEYIADALGANLFEIRLTGHGHTSEPMAGATAETWIDDVTAALAIGEALGDRLVVLSTSTGGTLSIAMLGHPAMARVDTLAMISPNLMPADPSARWLTRPLGPLLARMVAGETRTWTAHNDLQERYWSTTYPTSSVIEVMRLVDRAESRLPADIDHKLIMFVSPGDRVISPAAARAAFDAITAPKKEWVDIPEAGDPSNHVLAGDILSPGRTRPIADRIVEFVEPGALSERPAL